MSPTPEAELTDEMRARLLARPELILGDRELMRALVGAREADLGANVVDIRGRAMEVLESRLDRLEAAHETVIAAAHDNLSGMHMIHRAVLSLLEPMDFAAFVENLDSAVAPILRVETLRLIMESGATAPETGLVGPLRIVPAGTVAELILGGRRAPRGDDIILRAAAPQSLPFHDGARAPVRSEALVPIDLGQGRFPALLLIGSAEQGRFTPAQGTDLLRFFGQAFRLVLMSWLRE